MHRVIWPYNNQKIGLNVGLDSADPFEPVTLKAADASIFTVEHKGVQMHFGTHWVVTAAEGDFRLHDGTAVRLLVEVYRPSLELKATTAIISRPTVHGG